MAAFKVRQRFVQNPLRKHPRAFVVVVEGSEIYNFPIHHLLHFYSKFGRKSWSNRGTIKQITAETRRRANRCAGRARARRTAASASGPARAFPRPPLPEVPHSLRSLTRPEQRWSHARACRLLIRVVPGRCPPLPLAVLATPLVPSLPPVRRGAGRCPAHPYKPKAVPPCAYKHPVTSMCSAGAINGSRGELRAPAGCTPSRARLHLPMHLP
jgi:hypothetical protein